MTRTKLATFCATVLAGAVAWCLWLQHKDITRLEAENQALREPSSKTEVPGQVSQGLIEGQAVRMKNGGWSRLYVFGNGFAQIEWSDDGDFTAMERGAVRR